MILLTIEFPIYPQVKEIRGRTHFKKGDFEFGFSANLGQSTTTTKENYNSYNYYDSTISEYESEYSHGSIFLQIGANVGYYILDGLSIEPELDLRLLGGEFYVSLLGNVCYSFYIPQKSIYPYVKLGYGLSGLNEYYYGESRGLFESLDYRTINASAGLKLIYSSSTALRMEINYRNISGSNEYSYPVYYSYSDSRESEITVTVISLSMGLSILF